eukprot:NODE_603_length_6200_cov_0.292739.p4 type:complete len:161 gc:universal NODE_603_length_6200_cov_0.292739:5529-6011(+)
MYCCRYYRCGSMCHLCAFKSLKTLRNVKIPLTLFAQYLSLASHFCHLLMGKVLSVEGAIQFFSGMPISGEAALQVLLDKQVCEMKEDKVKSSNITRKFVNNKCYQSMRLLKEKLETAWLGANVRSKVRNMYMDANIPIKSKHALVNIPLKSRYAKVLINL